MKNSWNSVIFMKSEKSMSDMEQMSKWPGINQMWSTTGDWDWAVLTNFSTPEELEKLVMKMRDGRWATDTKTQMWKQMSA